MRIIIVTGLIGAGKDVAASYIVRKYSYTLLDHSRILGGMLRKMGRPTTRKEKIRLRKERGNTFTAEMINKEIQEKRMDNVVIGSSRRPEEYELTKKAFGESVKLLVVKASESVRFKRLLRRRRDRPKGWNDFLETDRLEEEVFRFSETFKHADFVVENDSSLKDLYEKIDRIMESL